jgi:integrase
VAVLAECPFCHVKQSAKNKQCKCGADLVKAKRSINFRMPDGKQRRQVVGYSIEEARDADGKRRSQKREHRIFDMLPESNMTFNDLTGWYLDLKTVKKLASYDRVKLALNNFNKVFGNQIVGTIIPVNLENYQEKRLEQKMAPATVDMEISFAKTMVTKAFDNDMVDGRVLKAFRSIKRMLIKGSNARKRILTFIEYIRLLKSAAAHLRPILKVAFNTGMRIGELRGLKWSYIDRKAGFIRLPATVTKEKKSKKIPINHHVWKVLKNIPRVINHDFVFTYKGNPIRSRSGLNHSFKTACNQAGIPCGRKNPDGITFHDIRRTVKTNMLNAGVDKAHRDLILGHSLQGMDSYYIAPDEKSLKKAMEKYTKWLDEQIAHALPSVDHSVDQDVKKD